jgi:hypothetical protein
MYKKATKYPSKLRMALVGPSGSGKTYSALRVAAAMGSRVALIDTEHGTSRAYAHIFNFDMVELDSFHPLQYVEAIRAAERGGYDVVIIDSLSHAWTGKNGALDLVDKAAKRSKTHSTVTAWRDVTPLHNALVETILQAQIHVIATLRAKTKYVLEQDEKGKAQVKKVGLEAVQREGLEYELDVVADLDIDNNLIISKARCPELNRRVFHEAGEELAAILIQWLSGADGDQTSPEPSEGVPCAESEIDKRPCPLAQATRALFDEREVDELGRRTAFRAIRDEFQIERLEDIPQGQHGRYWRFVTDTVLPAVKSSEQTAA